MPYYRFTGKELDPETGLYYYGARYYDPVLSRWISADPILAKYLPTGNKKQDTNLPGMGGVFNSANLGLYAYSHSNPINFVDPDGKEPVTIAIIAVGVAAGVFLAPTPTDEDYPWYEETADVLGAVASGIFIARTAAQQGLKAAAKEVFEEVTGLPTNIGDLTKLGKGAYKKALEGGKHAGFLKTYMDKAPEKLQKGIKSLEKQMLEHRDKIANPQKYIKNFDKLDPRQQKALLTKEWPAQIQKQAEQLEILKGILKTKEN